MSQKRANKSIRERAYILSIEKPENSELDNWVQAEAEARSASRLQNLSMRVWVWLKPIRPPGIHSVASLLVVCLATAFAIIFLELCKQQILEGELNMEKGSPLIANTLYQAFAVVVLIIVSWFLLCMPFIRRAAKEALAHLGDDRTAWEWINLMGAPTLFSLTAGIVTFYINQSSQDISKLLAGIKERETIVNEYIRDMTATVSDQKWTNSNYDKRIAISTRTFNALEALEGDGSRQATVLRFATRVFPDFQCLKAQYEVDEKPRKIEASYDKNCRWPSNISLKKIQLKGFRMDGTNSIYKGTLIGADLSGADLEGANFSQADLTDVQLKQANLKSTIFGPVTQLQLADLTGAILDNAVFDGTDLTTLRPADPGVNSQYSYWLGVAYASLDQLIPKGTHEQSSVLAQLINPVLEIIRTESQRINSSSSWNDAKYSRIYITMHPNYIYHDPFPRDFTSGYSKSKFCEKVNANKIGFWWNTDYNYIIKGSHPYNVELAASVAISDNSYSSDGYFLFFKRRYGCLPLTFDP